MYLYIYNYTGYIEHLKNRLSKMDPSRNQLSPTSNQNKLFFHVLHWEGITNQGHSVSNVWSVCRSGPDGS